MNPKQQAFLLLFILIFSACCIYFYEEKLYPAYVSFYYSCHPPEVNVTKFISERGFERAGEFDSNTENITLFLPDDSTIKHEVCHMEQQEYGRLYSCNQPIGKYLNEVECYFREDYMNYVNVSKYK